MTEPPTSGPGVGDDDLVARVRGGDQDALAALYDRYGRPCFALARRVTADSSFAEDVVQEVFLAVWRAPAKFDPGRGTFGSWLLAMTHHKAVDAVRREETLRRRRAEMTDNAATGTGTSGEDPPVDEQVWTGVRGDRVRAALRDLPGAQREALGLAYFGGYTQREVAALTGAPLGTVKTRMLAGMRRLATALGDVADAAGAADDEGALS